MARLSLSLLGSLHITLDGQSVSDFTYNKARALLTYLAVESDRAHHRDVLVGLLWPDMPDQAARTNLRQALAKLREAIGDATAAPPFLLITRDTIQFNLESDFELDVAAFTSSLTECQSHAHRGLDRCRPCAARMERAMSLYRGDFLQQFSLADSAPFEEWAVLKREQLRQSALTTLTQLASYYERRGGLEQALTYAERQIEMEPWLEEAYKQSMRLLARLGRRSLALAKYEACKRRLSEALGVAPARALTELYRRIRDGLELRGAGKRQWRLPAPPNALIGRERELETLSQLLSDPTCRLITITGPGGMGKTRLALASAHDEFPGFTHGAAWIDLASISTPDSIASAILTGLDVSLASQQEPVGQLLVYLQDKEMLLAVDNFEHLLDGSSLLGKIIEHAPGITLLVTSRERLALRAERLVELDGLDCPNAKDIQPLETFSAVQLFVQRAKAVNAGFEINQNNAPAIAEICTRLDGMPLAIELAAARSRLLAPKAMLEKLSSRLETLTSGARDLPARQKTLRSALDWSYDLLDAQEKTLFARLSVFRGGESLAAVETVCGPNLEVDVLEGIESLLNKSLLKREVDRFEMLDTIHEYARERLDESSEANIIRRRHAEFFAYWAEQLRRDEQSRSGTPQIHYEQLAIEQNNILAVFEWTFGGGDCELGLRLMGALYFFWLREGHWTESARWIAPVSQCLERVSEATRAGALAALGPLNYYGKRDVDAAKHSVLEALAIYRRLGDKHGAGRVMLSLAYYSTGRVEEYAESVSLAEEAIAQLQEEGQQWQVLRGFNILGELASGVGDYARAKTAYQHSLDIAVELANPIAEHIQYLNLGDIAKAEGDYEQAAALYRKSLTWFLDNEGISDVMSNIIAMSGLMARQGQPERAARLMGASEALLEEMGIVIQVVEQILYDRDVDFVRQLLGEERFNALRAEGRVMTLDEAVELALAELHT